jgi:hypothetical protein
LEQDFNIDIEDIDETSPISFTASEYIMSEAGVPVGLRATLRRTGYLVHTSVASVQLTGINATEGVDFTGTPITATFTQGMSEINIVVPIRNDLVIEPTESISLDVSLISNADAGTITSATLSIFDNDTTVVSNTRSSGAGSLRNAIATANATPDVQTVSFALPSASVSTIRLTSLLPAITDAIIIDGTTQAGYNGVPRIHIDGSAVAASGSGLWLKTGDSTVRGLSITKFKVAGIRLTGATGSTIAGNIIGTDSTSAIDIGNGVGVLVQNSPNNLIGGIGEDDTNVISGNMQEGIRIRGTLASGNAIQGNFIGTNTSGMRKTANKTDGIQVSYAANTLIGGPSPEHGNVISGNVGYGVRLTSANNTTVQNNRIGVNLIDRALANLAGGVMVNNSNSVVIGGVGTGNTIALNRGAGVAVTGTSTAEIRANRIYQNTGLGIDLQNDGITINDADDNDAGPNLLLNTPEISSASFLTNQLTVDYTVPTLLGNAAYPLTIDFYIADSDGKSGRVWLGSDLYSSDDAGIMRSTSFAPISFIGIGSKLIATATDANGNTSEFSLAFEIMFPVA